VARLRREARVAARLDRPGIVRIYELGRVEEQHYIAMQFVAGGNLADAAPGRAETVRIVRDVARALGHAHGAGIVHRDIKPENVLLDAEGRPWLTDFGVARDLRSRGMGTEGLVIGTPELMAPEQALGRAALVDARTDVYALGATLYRLLTGRPPFRKPDVVSTLYAVIHEPPRLPREVDPSIPAALQAIVLRCLCKDPRERYPGAAELALALDRWLEGEAATGGPADADASAEGRRYLAFGAPEPSGPDPTEALAAAAEVAAWDAERYRGASAAAAPDLAALTAHLEAVLAERPDAAWARFTLGSCLARLGRVAAAVEAMEASVDRLGGLGAAHLELGRLYWGLALAEQTEPGRDLAYASEEDHEAVVGAYLEQAAVAQAEARRLGAHVPAWLEPAGDALARLAAGDAEAAAAACRHVLAADPVAEEVWLLQGAAVARAGGDPALCYRRAAAVRTRYPEAWTALGEVLRARGDALGAAEAADAALRACSRHVPALVLRARLLVAALREDAPDDAVRAALGRATADLERAREGAPVGPDLRADYPGTPGGRGRFVEAVWLDQALQAIEGLAPSGGSEGDVARARALLRRARRTLLSGEDPRPDLDALLPRLLSPVGAETASAGQREWARLLEAAIGRREGEAG